jgi:hypothetical protein
MKRCQKRTVRLAETEKDDRVQPPQPAWRRSPPRDRTNPRQARKNESRTPDHAPSANPKPCRLLPRTTKRRTQGALSAQPHRARIGSRTRPIELAQKGNRQSPGRQPIPSAFTHEMLAGKDHLQRVSGHQKLEPVCPERQGFASIVRRLSLREFDTESFKIACPMPWPTQ